MGMTKLYTICQSPFTGLAIGGAITLDSMEKRECFKEANYSTD